MTDEEAIDNFLDVLVCPQCHGPLQASGQSVSCCRCCVSFPVRGAMLDVRLSTNLQQQPDWRADEFDREAERIGEITDFAETFSLPTSPVHLSQKAATVVECIYQSAIKASMLNLLRVADSDVLVDAGCGNGYFLFNILGAHKEATFRAIGTDVARPGVEILSKRARREKENRIFGVVGFIEKMPLGSNRVDTIICSEVMEHVSFPKNVIREMYRVLKPGGCLIISTPNKMGADFWHSAADRFFSRTSKSADAGSSHYERFLYWSELRRSLTSAGFLVKDVRFVKQVPWARVFVLFPWLPPLLVRCVGKVMETAMRSSRWAHNVVVVCKKENRIPGSRRQL